MIVIGWMVTACLASALGVASVVDAASARAVVAGMAGPLVSACGTWLVIDRALRTQPAALTRRLLGGFLVKVVLFLCYVFVAVRMFGVPVRPFAISFAAYSSYCTRPKRSCCDSDPLACCISREFDILMNPDIAQGHAPPPPAAEGFNAGEVIIGHVSNSSPEHALIHFPKVFGIDFSVTKHVFMLWLVAAGLFLFITWIVRRYARADRAVPDKLMSLLEIGVEFVRDTIVQPSVGSHWSKTWTPLLLTMFFFILFANAIGLVPIFDVLALADHFVLHTADDSFLKRLIHGGATATGNFNVTAGLAIVTFFTIMTAGTRAHGFVKHWKNLVPKGMPWPLYFLLVPLELIGLLVRPFALTARLAANMTGGHIALLAILSFVFIFTQMLGSAMGGIGIGLVFSVPLAALVSGLEIIVVLVQAYVFTLLSATFIGMAIHSDH